MKLIGSNSERQYRDELIVSRDGIFKKNSAPRLLETLRENYPGLTSAFVLHWIPEQGEDIYEVLINEHEVFLVEIPRDGMTDCVAKTLPMNEFLERTHSRQKKIKIAVAIDLIKSDK
mgnify:CR=1 FL=1|jgi:hypothetical protein